MSFAWYVCPYDTVPFRGTVGRRPAIARYIPAVPNADSANWDEAEILGNAVIVKVSAPDATHAQIQADPDFFVIPTDNAVIASSLRNGIRNRLTAIGYTTTEVNNTNWTVTALLDLLTTAASIVVINATNSGFDVLPGRRVAPKTVAQIEARLPG